MTTVDSIVTDVRRMVRNKDASALSDATILSTINGVIDMLEMEKFYFQVAETTLTLTVNQPDISINGSWPTNFSSELLKGGLSVLVSGTFRPLTKIGVREYDLRDNQNTGIPHSYTVKDDAIHLLPYPDSAYTLYLRYYKTYTDLTAGNSNDFTDRARRLVTFMTAAEIWLDEYQSRENFDKYVERAEEERKRQRRLTNSRRGNVSPTYFGVLPMTMTH